jgi:N-acetylmuramoyl-L-alanine amidase
MATIMQDCDGVKVPVKEVILHCAAIKTGQFDHMNAFQMFSEVNRWHKEAGFKRGFGYHGLITPGGVWYSGRPFAMKGGHCKAQGKNNGTIGILLIESRQITHIGRYADWFTQRQLDTFIDLLPSFGDIDHISGHNDYAPKLCPGFKVRSDDWLVGHRAGFPRGGDNFRTLTKEAADA